MQAGLLGKNKVRHPQLAVQQPLHRTEPTLSVPSASNAFNVPAGSLEPTLTVAMTARERRARAGATTRDDDTASLQGPC